MQVQGIHEALLLEFGKMLMQFSVMCFDLFLLRMAVKGLRGMRGMGEDAGCGGLICKNGKDFGGI